MKFNWGTGILIFLILFLIAAGFFIGFAMRQDVSLVHEDYYERGVDHTNQMKVEARSAQFVEAVKTSFAEGLLLVEVEKSVATQMDSATVQLYRPSDVNLDLIFDFEAATNPLPIPMERLVPGRYILLVNWSSAGLRYEVEKSIFIR